jgi:hypothetical protein
MGSLEVAAEQAAREVRLIQKLEEPGSLEACIKAVAFTREMCRAELDDGVEPDGVTGGVADGAAGAQTEAGSSCKNGQNDILPNTQSINRL